MSATAGREEVRHSSRVHFQPSATGWADRKAHDDFRWAGEGTVDVTDTRLVVHAQKHRAFRSAVADEASFELRDVRNVEVAGALVRVEIRSGEGVHHRFHARFDRPEEAAAFAARLPATRDERFQPTLTDAHAFATTLGGLQRRVPIIVALVTLNVAAFVVVGTNGGGWLVPDPEVLARFGSNFTPWTLHGEPWRLLTSTFLHFGVVHLALNLWALASSGPLAERLFGSWRFLWIYVAAGLGGSVASVLWHPVVNSAGASGAVFGVFGALGAYFVTQRGALPATVVAAQRNGIAVLVAINLVNGLTVPGIDNAAHLGGLVVGFALGALLSRPPGAIATATPRKEHARFIVAAAGTVALTAAIAVGLATRALHPRDNPLAELPQGESALRGSDGTSQRLATVRSVAGVSIGMTRDEVRAARGEPAATWQDAWVYDALGTANDAVIEVVFDDAGRVVAVFYTGDGSGRPLTLPSVRSRGDLGALEADYGPPVDARLSPDGDWYVRYANGIAVYSSGPDVSIGIDYR